MAIQKKEEFLKRLGKHVKKVRESKGISIREFELDTDFDRSLLSKIELGKKNISLNTLNKLIAGFDMTWDDFFKGFK